jgi:hypothetical protein
VQCPYMDRLCPCNKNPDRYTPAYPCHYERYGASPGMLVTREQQKKMAETIGDLKLLLGDAHDRIAELTLETQVLAQDNESLRRLKTLVRNLEEE